jgi:hypothetical protein
MTQKKIRGDQIDLTSDPIDGSGLFNVDADFLNGDNAAFYRDASNINAGTIGDAYLPATISSDITGTANNALALGGDAAALFAKLASPNFSGNPTAITQSPGNDSTRLATTEYVDDAVGAGGSGSITKAESSGFATTSNNVSWLHGLGAEPDIVSVIIQCISAEYGYSVGDRLMISLGVASWQTNADQDENAGMIVQVDTSRVYVRRFNRLQINDKSSLDTRRQITYSKWHYYIKAMVVA